ncbi:MAG: NHLP family bacteriocin export ABC transporter peptidase/permease/ATPase subunit [Candidatus Schekmanbacteria bacterium]|nr:NHLP family bacteriocin export ABC transporter peptidase/permease/ATPase subunit [Candidatus Schekmanbacteria bacterium]
MTNTTAEPAANSATKPTFKRIRTATILQMEAVECGAASLAIVLAHHGRHVPLEELRLATGVSRDGVTAKNIVQAARTYGLVAKGFRKTPENLRELQPPFIIHWNFNHFLVVEGIQKGLVYLNDPAAGPRTVSPEELDQAFSGVVLTFEPGPDFKKGGQPRTIWPALRSRLAGSAPALTYVVLVGLALVIPGLVIPIFTKTFVDQILVGQRHDWMTPLLLGMGLAALLQGALTWLQRKYLLRLETKLAIAATGRFLWHVLRLPVEFFTQRYAGDISQRVSSNDRVAQLLSGDLATTVVSLVQIAFFVSIMFVYDAVLTVIGLSVAGLNIAALRYVSRRRKDGSQRMQQDMGKVHGAAMNGLMMIETLKATGSEGDFFTRWSGYQAKVLNAQQELGRMSAFLGAVPGFLGTVNTVAILGIGGLRVMDGELTMGTLIAFQALMGSFMRPINQLVSLGSTLQEVEADMARIDDVVRYAVDPACGEASRGGSNGGPVRLSGRLELAGVSFGYSRLAPALITDFSLSLRPGARVALVGGSGSGKSTVAKLVTGLYAPWAGEVRLDGAPLRAHDRRVIAGSVALVDQEIFLLEGSVRDNLAMWDTTLPEEVIVQAAQDAHIHDDIAARAGGYASPVAEGGSNFSGGQRQRLEIARALVGNPALLVLDEATSALDATTERIIDENIRRRGCTCLIIAHRLSTIRDADEIIVLDRGKVVQRGIHDELIRQDGTYARLIAAE